MGALVVTASGFVQARSPARVLVQLVEVAGLVLGLAVVVYAATIELLNASYDPTRELWRELNGRFAARYERETGHHLTIRQSHGGSSTQARAVIDGLEADVVTLALFGDTDAIRKKGLIDVKWVERLPNRSVPYTSTVVFAVRRGNPKGIRDWPDLVRPGVAVVTPNPKTSGNGKLSFLAAWAAVIARGGSEKDAREFVARLYGQVPVLDSGARGSTVTFVQRKIGDVHLTWENEAVRAVAEAPPGEVEIVRPPVSVLAEPPVTVVDATVDRKGTRSAATAYLRWLFTEEAQEIIARHGYRPVDAAVLARHRRAFPPLTLVPVTALARDWSEAQEKFFDDGKIFDQVVRR